MNIPLPKRSQIILRHTGTYRILQRANEFRYLKRRIEFYKTFLAQREMAFDIGATWATELMYVQGWVTK
jgi:hypothetical protein